MAITGEERRTVRSGEEAQALSPAMLIMAPLVMWPVATRLQVSQSVFRWLALSVEARKKGGRST